MSWGDGAELQQFCGSSQDLSLDLGFDLDSQYSSPSVQSNGHHREM